MNDHQHFDPFPANPPKPFTTQIAIGDIINIRCALATIKPQTNALLDAAHHLDTIILNFTRGLISTPNPTKES